ncbi:MAG: hypothetical protein DRR19_19390 [Candidatus Parabeggiatoa sp. nov. 1]|nr:MAG: hypothetical protein DRR19_19390 [Gammaproteobacteria bacterium]
MRKHALRLRTIVIEGIIAATEAGIRDGGNAFVETMRQTLAAQLGMKPEQIFSGYETLGDSLSKAKILPFKTPAEINTWKPRDYDRLNQALTDYFKGVPGEPCTRRRVIIRFRRTLYKKPRYHSFQANLVRKNGGRDFSFVSGEPGTKKLGFD